MMTRGDRWVAFAPLMLLAVITLTGILTSACSAQKANPSRTIAITADTGAARLLEKLHTRRTTMEALVAKERSYNRRFDAAMEAGNELPKFQKNASDERTYDALDALGDSFSGLVTHTITGLAAGKAGQATARLAYFLWATPTSDTRVWFSLSVNYEGNWSRSGFPTRHAAVADISEVAFRLVPKLFEFYPRLEEIELREHVNSFVVATLTVPRNRVPPSAKTPDDFSPFVELNQALIKMGKM